MKVITMEENVLASWDTVFSDVNCVRVMLYLAKYNPDSQVRDIIAKLKISNHELDAALNKLMSAHMVEYKNTAFTLKRPALIAIHNFIQLTALGG